MSPYGFFGPQWVPKEPGDLCDLELEFEWKIVPNYWYQMKLHVYRRGRYFKDEYIEILTKWRT